MTIDEQAIYPEIAKIREALWGISGRASVMIGAGFSRQAEPLVPNPPRFPLWPDIQRQMEAELALTGTGEQKAFEVAQVYQNRFGRVALERLLANQIPDSAYGPGENHRRLMALDWADVFTTNYDTLLERAASEVFNRRYERIVSHEDLPLRTAPRIVKLHGSLPHHRPFIVTRADYDAYQETHAPFVNLVRESVMETVFVLLGFSGDDPNFLQWSSWVKDQLGHHAPPIYLCGILDLTPDKQREIAARHVSPIDLGSLFPAAQFPQRDARRLAALSWFLQVLEHGQPTAPREWAPLYSPKATPLQPPGPTVKYFTPSEERAVHFGENVTPDVLRKWTTNWRAQREEYPGWIVAPARNRQRVPTQLLTRLCEALRSGDSDLTRRAAGRLLFLVRRAWLTHSMEMINAAPHRLGGAHEWLREVI